MIPETTFSSQDHGGLENLFSLTLSLAHLKRKKNFLKVFTLKKTGTGMKNIR
jgi:hypothetical protein